MHDRRIDDETVIFGNAGGLFMNAMTWYDHGTESIWSQPWGRAIDGPLKGVELFLLPVQLTTWENWRDAHPETLLMTNDLSRWGGQQTFSPAFVIGLVLGDEAKAYPYRDVAAAGVIHDVLDGIPILVWAANQNFHAYVRRVDERELTFRVEGGQLLDKETGSAWDVTRGLAVSGPLQGAALQAVPGMTSYAWAWQDFYPEGAIYEP